MYDCIEDTWWRGRKKLCRSHVIGSGHIWTLISIVPLKNVALAIFIEPASVRPHIPDVMTIDIREMSDE